MMNTKKHEAAVRDYKARANAADAFVEYLEATRGREFVIG